MILSDLARAAIVVSLGAAVPFLLHSGLGDLAIVLPVALLGAFAAFFSPCRQALLPLLIRDNQLVRANALISAVGTVGAITSVSLGGALVDLAREGHFSLHWNYLGNGATYLLSATFVAFIAMHRARPARTTCLTSIWRPIREGFRYVRTHRRTLQIILLGGVFWAAGGLVMSVVPALVRDLFGGGYTEAGLYRGLIVAGIAVGSIVLTIFGNSLPTQLAVLGGLLGGAGWLLILTLCYVFDWHRYVAALALFGMGGAGAGLLVTVMATIQRIVPNDRRGRVFGVSDLVTMGALTLAAGGLGLAPIPNMDRYVPFILALTTLGFLAVLVIAFRIYRRNDGLPATPRIVIWIITFWARFWWRVRRVGHCTVPTTGPVIIAASHRSGIDPLALIVTSPHRLPAFLVADKYYHHPFFGRFMRMARCVPVNRERPGKATLASSLELLRRGGLLGIFPYGTFQRPDEPEPEPKPGVGALALRSGATVIPACITGTTFDDRPYGALVRRHDARVRYGTPVDLSDLHAAPYNKANARIATRRIVDSVSRLERQQPAADRDNQSE